MIDIDTNGYFETQEESCFLPTISELKRLASIFEREINEHGNNAFKKYLIFRCGYTTTPESNNDILIALKMGMGFIPADL